jgi:hypothetical protein
MTPSKRIAADEQIDAARKNELQKDIVAAIKNGNDFQGLDANVRGDIENELK